MRVNWVYELIVSRGGCEFVFMLDSKCMDRIEVVLIDDGEVILYWNVNVKDVAKLLKLF